MKAFKWVICKVKGKICFIYRRVRNIRQLYIYPDTQDGWVKYPQKILGNKKTGSLFDPYVYYENEIFYLFLSSRKNGSIVRTISKDGINWGQFYTILCGIPDSRWEKIVNRGKVLKVNNKWMMWYTGQANGRSAIGVATSSDGIHFERFKDNPVIYPEYSYEQIAVMNPSVIWDEKNSIYKMWYCAGEQCEPDVICYATSRDGIYWTKYQENPVFEKSDNIYDFFKVGGCEVILLDNETYGMFYIGYQNIDNARICYAYSSNGREWKRVDCNPIISPSKNRWDSHAVYKPAFLFDEKNSRACLWYNGRKGIKEYIGFATKKIVKNKIDE